MGERQGKEFSRETPKTHERGFFRGGGLYFEDIVAQLMVSMIRGFFSLLAGLVLVSGLRAQETATNTVQSDVLDGTVLRYRVGTVTDGLAAEFAKAQPTNVIAGVVLDLRFAGGPAGTMDSDFGFFSKNKKPLVVLVNSRTEGAAAALATRLRSAGLGVLIGGTEAVPVPDLTVAVSAETEKHFQADPYLVFTNLPAGIPPGTNAVAAGKGTNDWSVFVDHTSEADLVRKKVKDGQDDGESAALPRSPAPPVIHDPALARAVDLLKALAALHPAHG